MLINCDLGEGFGAWTMAPDEALMPHIQMANLACGFHAGDAEIMAKRVDWALAQGVRIGAHVSYPDLAGFGRRALPSSSEQVVQWCQYQYGALHTMTYARRGIVEYVKPHGALYHRLHQDLPTLELLCQSMREWPGQPNLMLMAGPAGQQAIECAKAAGIFVIKEAFADRAYESDGRLRSRDLPGAVLTDWELIQAQVEGIRAGKLTLADGQSLPIEANTLCIHSDSPGALEIAQRLSAWSTQSQ